MSPAKVVNEATDEPLHYDTAPVLTLSSEDRSKITPIVERQKQRMVHVYYSLIFISFRHQCLKSNFKTTTTFQREMIWQESMSSISCLTCNTKTEVRELQVLRSLCDYFAYLQSHN